MVFDVDEPGQCQRTAEINVSKQAERIQSRESGTKVSTESIFQRKGNEIGRGKPYKVANYTAATKLLNEDQRIDYS